MKTGHARCICYENVVKFSIKTWLGLHEKFRIWISGFNYKPYRQNMIIQTDTEGKLKLEFCWSSVSLKRNRKKDMCVWYHRYDLRMSHTLEFLQNGESWTVQKNQTSYEILWTHQVIIVQGSSCTKYLIYIFAEETERQTDGQTYIHILSDITCTPSLHRIFNF